MVDEEGEEASSAPPAGSVPVLLVDRRDLTRLGLRSMLSSQPDVTVVGEALDTAQALALGRQLLPSVVVVSGDGVDPVDVTSTLVGQLSPPPAVLLLVPEDSEPARRAVAAGAAGLLLEHVDRSTLLAGVRLVAAGYTVLWSASGRPPRMAVPGLSPLAPLTERERDVFELIAGGYSNAEIAESLSLSHNTVKSHIQSLLTKLGLHRRVEVVVFAYAAGLRSHGTRVRRR